MWGAEQGWPRWGGCSLTLRASEQDSHWPWSHLVRPPHRTLAVGSSLMGIMSREGLGPTTGQGGPIDKGQFSRVRTAQGRVPADGVWTASHRNSICLPILTGSQGKHRLSTAGAPLGTPDNCHSVSAALCHLPQRASRAGPQEPARGPLVVERQ